MKKSKSEINNSSPTIEVKSGLVTKGMVSNDIEKKQRHGADLIGIISARGFTRQARDACVKNGIVAVTIDRDSLKNSAKGG